MTSSSQKSAVDRRAEELDTIASVLPMERRDELAELLTDQDVETLRHLVNQGMGDNTLRALTSDLAYLEAWGLAATGRSLPWPAPEALLLKFVAQHLWDPEKRAVDPDHGSARREKRPGVATRAERAVDDGPPLRRRQCGDHFGEKNRNMAGRSANRGKIPAVARHHSGRSLVPCRSRESLALTSAP